MQRSTAQGLSCLAGLLGFNNLKLTDYANVVLQSLCRVPLLRDFFLKPSNYAE